MKVQEFKRGEVTAFLALIFILLVAFAGSLMESASLQSAKSYRRTDMNRAVESVFAEYQKELLKEFDIFALEGSYETGEYDEQKILDRLSYYGASGMDQQISRIQLLTDNSGQAFLEQISRYIENKYGFNSLNSLLAGMDEWSEPEDTWEQYQETEAEFSQELSGILSENDLELPAENNPLPNMQNLASAPLVELAMPDGQSPSEKSLAPHSTVSGRQLRKGYGDFSDAAEEAELSAIAFGEYVLTHFSSAVSEQEPENGAALDYQVEYIMSGKDSDRENLEAVLKKLLLLRYIPNYAYLQGNAGKRAETEALAVTLCTVIALPAAAEALAQLLLLTWAFGESVMDLRSLLQGGKVPLAKTDDSWQLPLSGLMTLGQEGAFREGKDTAGGLTYKDYLRVLLFLNPKQSMPLRTLDMIELYMRQEKGFTWFRADNCVSRMEITSTVNLRRGITYQFQTYYGYR